MHPTELKKRLIAIKYKKRSLEEVTEFLKQGPSEKEVIAFVNKQAPFEVIGIILNDAELRGLYELLGCFRYGTSSDFLSRRE